MPLYEYRCRACGERFEKLVRSSQSADPVRCPACDAAEAERAVSTFATAGVRGGSPFSSGDACAPSG